MSASPTTFAVPETQRAAVITAFDAPYTISTSHPVPSPSTLTSNQCIIKMLVSGCCHSDMHIRKGEWRGTTTEPPLIGGHEGVGIIVALGESSVQGVKCRDGSVRVGDRVGVKWTVDACGMCEHCRTGFDSLCPSRKNCGQTVDGTFAEYMLAWTNHVIPIPPSLESHDAAPILCAGLTVYSALKKSNTIVGNWVVIPGAGGGLGHLAIQYAAAMGLRVLAIDTGSSKKSACLSRGAEHFIDFQECIAAATTSASESGKPEAEKSAIVALAVVKEIVRVCGGVGPHAAVIISPSPASYEDALKYLRPRGTLVAVGIPTNFPLGVYVGLLVAKSLRIVGSLLGNQQDAIEALDLVARGKVKTHVNLRKMEEINEIFDEMEKGTLIGRAVIQF
ncbi:mannitol-1-phosphate dehydrogenase MPDH1 [Stereum hirsutum FP-91666 SS1]|uniref:mannitol-1-phosphate dehydrogenase MPDH1 n=1 Tax=Stereum hirsutum (strain FP-91666) TaxID=721885 RepID=UPI0004449BCF|nr:mannitol-1-phosphate dehydrogenase MPDH1 [Stereum hirsutum FP-91666 SS1]EIM83178.1 mannitol-1-phosphate dehydrogenase MPDH1 [Stereum hirsutum FP-91666 SS1]